jgi:uncharacterized membrane protein YdjX (TVP38/TMEM64 family)
LIVGAIVVGLAIWAVAAGLPVRAWADDGLAALRAAGPLCFFTAMAVLPAFGFPMLPFVLAAGPTFGPTLGPAVVVGCAVAAIAVNTLLGYWLAHRALRPLALRVLARFGCRVPALPPGTVWQVVFVVRLTPGLPFWVQSYLLGMMRVALVPYVVASTMVPACYVTAAIYGGDALLRGRTGTALVALAAFGLIGGAIQFWRRWRAHRSTTLRDGAMV